VKPTEEPIGLFVTRTAKSLSRAFDDALGEAGGSLPAWLVLTSLAWGEHRTQRAIAAHVGIEGATLTHHLNRMEAAGLVTRERDPENRRAHHVALTEAGQAELGSMLGAVQAFDQRLRASFTTDELATLRSLLQRLAGNATDRGPDTPKETPR
jgi:MarR family transcriptional regulator for hemolysin